MLGLDISSVDFSCGRCRVDLISGSHYPCHVECVLYYVVYLQFAGLNDLLC